MLVCCRCSLLVNSRTLAAASRASIFLQATGSKQLKSVLMHEQYIYKMLNKYRLVHRTATRKVRAISVLVPSRKVARIARTRSRITTSVGRRGISPTTLSHENCFANRSRMNYRRWSSECRLPCASSLRGISSKEASRRMRLLAGAGALSARGRRQRGECGSGYTRQSQSTCEVSQHGGRGPQ